MSTALAALVTVALAANQALSQAAANPAFALPAEMHVCTVESVRRSPCGVWTLRDGHYDGLWRDIGVTATITVESFGPNSVTMTRNDYGTHRGIYYYSGKVSRQGNSIENGEVRGIDGHVIGLFNASWESMVAPTPAPLIVDRAILPPVMHFCALNCFTLELRGDHYEASNRPAAEGQNPKSIWTVEQFTLGRPVLLHRQDAPDPSNPPFRRILAG